MHKDGTTTSGLVQKVEKIDVKQDESAKKLDATIADLGDVKSAQADQGLKLDEQGRTLNSHTASFARIEAFARRTFDIVWKGVLGVIGLGFLHLLYLWWGAIAAFFTTLGQYSSAAAAATRIHH